MIFILPWIVAILLLLLIDRSKERTPNARSPYKAAAASLILPGLGQLYNGQLLKALIFWIAGVILSLLTLLLGLLYQFWGMVSIMLIGLAISAAALIDSIQSAKVLQSYTLKTFNRWYFYFGAFFLAILVSIPLERSLKVKAFKIPSEAMLPTFEVGDFFITRLETPESYKNRRGDILVFRYPGDNITTYIKRVVAFPGEEIEIRANTLFIDGQRITDSWFRKSAKFTHNNVMDYGPFTVPDGTLFMLGDNIVNSADSRHWGPLPRENIIGVAEFIYFSWDPIKRKIRFNRIGLKVDGDS